MPGKLYKQSIDSLKYVDLTKTKRPGSDKPRIANLDILKVLLEASLECDLDMQEQTELLSQLNALNES